MPKVTVIVPVYKVEDYLEKCFDSLQNQNFRDFEIVLVDDGSPDSSGKMCDELVSRSEAQGIPLYVIHQTNRGLSGARNSGIDWAMLCSGSEWICFVDSDDTVKDTFIEKLFCAVNENNADLAICDYMEPDEKGKLIDEPHSFHSGVVKEKNTLFNMLHNQWRIHPAWNKLYRKSLFSHLRFEVGKLHEDEFIIHHVLFACNVAVFVSEALYIYLIRSNGIMGGQNRQTKRDGYWADIFRYWFCKNNQLPLDPGMLTLDYMLNVHDFHDKEILNEYRKIFFDYDPNNSFMNKLKFRFPGIYKLYRNRRLG